MANAGLALATQMLDLYGVDAVLHVLANRGAYKASSGQRISAAFADFSVRAMNPDIATSWDGTTTRKKLQTFTAALGSGTAEPRPGDSITIGTQRYVILQAQLFSLSGEDIGWLFDIEAIAAPSVSG